VSLRLHFAAPPEFVPRRLATSVLLRLLFVALYPFRRQGGVAFKPGNIITARVGRALQREIFNFGFSGELQDLQGWHLGLPSPSQRGGGGLQGAALGRRLRCSGSRLST